MALVTFSLVFVEAAGCLEKNMSRKPWVCPELCHLPAGGSWVGHLTSLGRSSFNRKTELTVWISQSLKDSEILDHKFISSECTCMTHDVTAPGWEAGWAQVSPHLWGFPHSPSILHASCCWHRLPP